MTDHAAVVCNNQITETMSQRIHMTQIRTGLIGEGIACLPEGS